VSAMSDLSGTTVLITGGNGRERFDEKVST
jgi:hypothetical protein